MEYVFSLKQITVFRYRYCVLFVDTMELLRKQRKHQVLCVYVKEDFMETDVNMKVNLPTSLSSCYCYSSVTVTKIITMTTITSTSATSTTSSNNNNNNNSINNNNNNNNNNILVTKFSNTAEYNTHKNFSLFYFNT